MINDKIQNSNVQMNPLNPRFKSWVQRCLICLFFAFTVPAHADWTQTDWVGGDSQCIWVNGTERYDTDVNIDNAVPGQISIVKESDYYDTGVLLSSTYDAGSLVVWKTIDWNNRSTLTDPYDRGDSRLRKDEVTDLVGLWHFDEGEHLAGGTSADDFAVYDESANCNTGVVHGSWWEQASDDSAVFQSALYFDGLGGYVNVPSSTSLNNITDAITIEAWVNSLSATASSSTVYEFSSDGADTDKWGWRCSDLTNIANLVPGTETALNDTALANIAFDDASYDEAGDSHDIKYHRFEFTITEAEDNITQIQATWVAHDEHTSYESFLYIWDFDGTQWVQIDSFLNGNIKHTYQGTLTTDLTKYVDGSGFLYVLGTSCNPGPSRWLRTHYVKVEVSYGVPSHPEVNISKEGSYGIGATLTTAAVHINGQVISSAVSPGWNHISLTYDKDAGGTDEMKLYVNGVEEVTHDTDAVIASNSNSFKIGREFNGLIDEVAVYSRAKTAYEIWQDSRGTQVRFKTQTTSSILGGNPVGLWHFDNLDDDPVSTTAHDSSIYDNDGTIYNDAAWSQYGVFGKCIHFDGTGDYVGISHSTSLVSSGNITVEAWVKSEADGADQGIVGKLVSSSSSGFLLNKDSTNKFSFSVGDGKLLNNITSGLYAADTGWHHVAGVINGTTMYLYVDGDEKATKSLGTSPIVDSGGSAYIGKSYSDLATDYFDGYIDEVAIYNYAKPAKQIAIDAREGQPWSPWSHSYYKNGDEDDVVLFADDFNDNTVDASDWDVIAGIGSWSEGNDDTTHDSGIITCSTAGCVIASNSNWYDEQVTVRIKFKTDGEAGIAYRWTNADGGHVVYMDSLADKVYIYTIKSTGVKDDLAAVSESLTIDTGIWYTLKVTSNGTQDRIYVNSESPCITYSNAAAKGKAGLYNSTGDAAIFDDFKVHPIDRYVRYEATLTDNLDKDTTPYLYRVKLNYENIAEDTLWSKIWQDKYGLHVNDVPAEVTWAPKDEDSLLTWSVLNCADIDLADTTWCYNLENYDDDRITPFNNPDGGLRVFVEVPVPVTDYVNLKFGYRTALTTPVTWPPNKTDYTWDDGDGWIMFIPGTDGVCDREYTCSDTEVWKCTFTEDQLTANFSKEAGYILWAQAASSGGNIEEEPLGFTPIDGDRADTSIIHMMKDITPPGSSNTSGGWPWQAGESGYQPVAGRDNDNWIGIEKDPDARLRIKGVQSSSNPEGTETWYINSSNTWINFDSSQNDSGILVSVEDKNPDVTRTVDCSGLKEKAFDDSPTRYVYSTKAYDREWRHPDYVLPIDITDIDEWAECDTGWDVSNEIRYLALGNSYDYPMPNLETMSSKEGRDILIQFAQKDKAGNWGYSHPNYDHYYAHSSVGYYINYDITKPISRIISAPREANYSGSASFGFDDNSADDSTLFCAFSTRLELNNDTDKTSGTYTVVTGYDWSTYQPWLPVSDKSSATFSSLNSSTFWYRCSVKAMDEALNVSDTYDTYYFQCLAPVPNTIIYSGPAGVITDDDGSYDAVFKFRGEGGSITPYEYAYSLNGNTWTDLTTATIHSEPIGYGNHTFRVRARNNGTTDGDTDTTDQTPASVTFTIVNPAQLPNASSPSNPVKYWREESE